MRLNREKLLRARELLGYGIEKVAEEAGVSKNSVLRAEHEGDIRPLTARRIAAALGVEVADLLDATEPAKKAEAPPDLQQSFAGLLEEERRLCYLSSWRAFTWKLVKRWESDPPETPREVSVVLDAMQALIDEGAFQRPPGELTTSDKSEFGEWFELSQLFRGLDRLNRIAEDVEADTEAERRRAAFEQIQGQMPG